LNTITLLYDRVLVKRLESPKSEIEGFTFIGKPEIPDIGEVLVVGKGKVTKGGKQQPMTVTVGDKVILPKYAGQTIDFNGEHVLIVCEEDILGIIT